MKIVNRTILLGFVAFNTTLLSACNETSTQSKDLALVDIQQEQMTQKSLKESQNMPILVNGNGSYKTTPLEKEIITLKVIQSGVSSLSDFPTPEQGLKENLARMASLAEQACTTGHKPDILLYHEFPLTGYSQGTREEKLKFTLKIPGPETQALGKIAKDCDTYLIFGSYATDDDWPGHILSINTVIGRDGTIVKKFWKSRNIKRLYADREITTTTIEAVRDRYRAMYGVDEEFPVLRTEFGNIAVSTVQFDPFIFAAFAMKGTEIMLRTATLYAEEELIGTARTMKFYSAMSNITLPAGLKYKGGNSIIVAPDGEVLAREASTTDDAVIEAQIPIAKFRKNRTIPNFALEMTQPIFNQYRQEIPINHLDMPQNELPQTGKEMKTLFDRISRFLN
ncbi:nitrilase-related carbon-nitrogen hydrolase [Thalassotalea piscium]